jgi:CheY-like chemotaxis protein
VTHKGAILVVDDDRLVLATLAHGLTQAGYDVIDADNGDDAILLAREHRPDLALLDIRMEGKTGFDVAAYLRESNEVTQMFEGIEQFIARWLHALVRDHRSYVTVAIGCTGGQHRSVYLVEELARRFSSRWTTLKRHRELDAG